MRVLTVAERVDLLERDGQTGRIGVRGPGQAGLVGQGDAGGGHPGREDLGDPRVVGGRVAERLHGQRRPEPIADRSFLLDRGEDRRVPVWRGDDRDAGVVLGSGPDHRRPADVDLLDELVEGDARPLGRGRERVQVRDDQLERRDRRGQELAPVIRRAAVREDARVDPRVKGLDPPVEHLREARHRGDVGHRQACLAERACGPAGGHELEPRAHEAGPELGQARLVPDRQQRAPRDRGRRISAFEVRDDVPSVGRHRDGPGEDQRDGVREQAVLGGADPVVEGGVVVRGEDRDGLLGHDRPAVEGLVDEVHGAAGHGHAVGQGIRDRVGTREGRQQRWVGVEDASPERGEDPGPHDPHEAGEDDDIRLDRRQRVGQRRVVGTRDDGRLDPLLDRPVDRRARAVGEDQDDLAAELAAPRRGCQRPKVRSGTRHADGDPSPTRIADPFGHAGPSNGAST